MFTDLAASNPDGFGSPTSWSPSTLASTVPGGRGAVRYGIPVASPLVKGGSLVLGTAIESPLSLVGASGLSSPASPAHGSRPRPAATAMVAGSSSHALHAGGGRGDRGVEPLSATGGGKSSSGARTLHVDGGDGMATLAHPDPADGGEDDRPRRFRFLGLSTTKRGAPGTLPTEEPLSARDLDREGATVSPMDEAASYGAVCTVGSTVSCLPGDAVPLPSSQLYSLDCDDVGTADGSAGAASSTATATTTLSVRGDAIVQPPAAPRDSMTQPTQTRAPRPSESREASRSNSTKGHDSVVPAAVGYASTGARVVAAARGDVECAAAIPRAVAPTTTVGTGGVGGAAGGVPALHSPLVVPRSLAAITTCDDSDASLSSGAVTVEHGRRRGLTKVHSTVSFAIDAAPSSTSSPVAPTRRPNVAIELSALDPNDVTFEKPPLRSPLRPLVTSGEYTAAGTATRMLSPGSVRGHSHLRLASGSQSPSGASPLHSPLRSPSRAFDHGASVGGVKGVEPSEPWSDVALAAAPIVAVPLLVDDLNADTSYAPSLLSSTRSSITLIGRRSRNRRRDGGAGGDGGRHGPAGGALQLDWTATAGIAMPAAPDGYSSPGGLTPSRSRSRLRYRVSDSGTATASSAPPPDAVAVAEPMCGGLVAAPLVTSDPDGACIVKYYDDADADAVPTGSGGCDSDAANRAPGFTLAGTGTRSRLVETDSESERDTDAVTTAPDSEWCVQRTRSEVSRPSWARVSNSSTRSSVTYGGGTGTGSRGSTTSSATVTAVNSPGQVSRRLAAAATVSANSYLREPESILGADVSSSSSWHSASSPGTSGSNSTGTAAARRELRGSTIAALGLADCVASLSGSPSRSGGNSSLSGSTISSGGIGADLGVPRSASTGDSVDAGKPSTGSPSWQSWTGAGAASTLTSTTTSSSTATVQVAGGSGPSHVIEGGPLTPTRRPGVGRNGDGGGLLSPLLPQRARRGQVEQLTAPSQPGT